VRKISVIMPPPCAQTPVEVLGLGLVLPELGPFHDGFTWNGQTYDCLSKVAFAS